MTRFSQLYLAPGELAQDSDRMRRRLAAVVLGDLERNVGAELATTITRRLGTGGPRNTFSQLDWTAYFRSAEIRDVLDTVTVAFEVLQREQRRQQAASWLREVRTIFREERVRYRVDDNAVVHFAVDEQFERDRASTLAGLGVVRYAAAREAFQHAYEVLAEVPPNGKLALRGVFEALEIIFKLFFPRSQRLGGNELRQFLKPEIDRRYAGDPAALRSAQKLHNSLVEWVEGMHFYRHGQGVEEPTQPPLDVAILGVSTGAAFLRWLLEFDPET
jgi:hypothetical protein